MNPGASSPKKMHIFPILSNFEESDRVYAIVYSLSFAGHTSNGGASP